MGLHEPDMVFSNVKYIRNQGGNCAVRFTCNGVDNMSCPMTEQNSHYAEILKQVAAGTITITDAD